ncbi:MAG: hypothetical protein QF903_10040 [Planctomycetota bacterium]|jgi:hypothetical protein|nr:hypothetical protein [Planctomycetota bacterium]
MASRTPRSLIVVSRDYGELGLACSLLEGQALAREATLLLPGSLYFANEHALPAAAVPYSRARDIRAVIAARRPELVFLLSGYLLANDGLLSPDGVESLVGFIEESGATLVTSDPFLGLAGSLDLGKVDIEMLVARYPRWVQPFLRLMLRFRSRHGVELCDVPALRSAIQLYPTAAPEGSHLPAARRLSFFNPVLCGVGEEAGAEQDAPASWLFLLSTADLHVQLARLGKAAFADLLAARLADAVAAGRRPTLLGSALVPELLRGRVGDEVELLSTCPFAEFTERLKAAEVAFYWNSFSHSLLARVARGLPVFLFDRGHLAHTVAPFHEAAVRGHFGGVELPSLDQTAPLDADDLASLAADRAPDLRAILERWRTAPTPDELAAALAGERRQAKRAEA